MNDRTQPPGDHADLIARGREEFPDHVDVQYNPREALALIHELTDALEAQPALLLAESREALARWHRPEAMRASGVVSLAADRDRVMKAEGFDEARNATWDAWAANPDREPWVDENPYRESEGK